MTLTTQQKLTQARKALQAFVTWCEQPNPEIGGCRRIDTEGNSGGYAAYQQARRILNKGD
jgi:hypothetical protein